MTPQTFTVAAAGLFLAILVGSPSSFAREPMTDAQVKQVIIDESVAKYHASGRPCACPYDRMRNGAACGARSAYSKPGGASPVCFDTDITDAMIQSWRRRQ